MNPNSKEFKDLQAKWYKKAEKAGHKDIENSFGRLQTGANNNLQNKITTSQFAARQEYYRLAGHFLHEHQFENKFDKSVWENHCEGTSVRDIAKKLRSHRDKVDKTIQRLRKAMISLYGVTNAE